MDRKPRCKDCIEWEYFYGCSVGKTMIPIDAENCEFYCKKDSIPWTTIHEAQSVQKKMRGD